MPGWGVQGGERSQPFVLSYSQLFFTCASFHNNKREFNFNALSGKKRGGNIYSILKQRSGLASMVKYICTRLCMMHRQLTGATRMTSTQTHTQQHESSHAKCENTSRLPPKPNHNCMQPYLYRRKSKMRKETPK